jgi:hypothetical protein
MNAMRVVSNKRTQPKKQRITDNQLRQEDRQRFLERYGILQLPDELKVADEIEAQYVAFEC